MQALIHSDRDNAGARAAAARGLWAGPRLAAGAALLGAAALLFAFDRVVRHGVQLGADRRALELALSGDAGCCNLAKGRSARAACLLRMGAQRSAAAASSPPVPLQRTDDGAARRGAGHCHAQPQMAWPAIGCGTAACNA